MNHIKQYSPEENLSGSGEVPTGSDGENMDKPPRTEQQATNTHYINHEPQNITVNVPPTVVNLPEETKIKDSMTIANYIGLIMALITGVLAYYTWQLFDEASRQSEQVTKTADAAVAQAKDARFMDSLTLESIRKSHFMIVPEETWVWRHAYIDSPKRRTMQFQFEMRNNMPTEIDIQYFKYKMFFKNYTSVIDTARKKIIDSVRVDKIQLDSVNCENNTVVRQDETSSDGFISVSHLQIDATLTEQDSAALAKNENAFFLEIHYANRATEKKYKYQLVGTIDGTIKRDSNRKIIDTQYRWRNIYKIATIPIK